MMKMKYIVFPLESVIYDGEEILKRIVEHCRKGKMKIRYKDGYVDEVEEDEID